MVTLSMPPDRINSAFFMGFLVLFIVRMDFELTAPNIETFYSSNGTKETQFRFFLDM